MTDKILLDKIKKISLEIMKMGSPFLTNPNEEKEPYYIDAPELEVPYVNYNQYNPNPVKLNPKWTKENGAKLFSDFSESDSENLKSQFIFDLPTKIRDKND